MQKVNHNLITHYNFIVLNEPCSKCSIKVKSDDRFLEHPQEKHEPLTLDYLNLQLINHSTY